MPRSGRFWVNIPENCTFPKQSCPFSDYYSVFQYASEEISTFRVFLRFVSVHFLRYCSFPMTFATKRMMQHELRLSSGPSCVTCADCVYAAALLPRLRTVYVIRAQGLHHEDQHQFICCRARSGYFAAIRAGFQAVKCRHPAAQRCTASESFYDASL